MWLGRVLGSAHIHCSSSPPSFTPAVSTYNLQTRHPTLHAHNNYYAVRTAAVMGASKTRRDTRRVSSYLIILLYILIMKGAYTHPCIHTTTSKLVGVSKKTPLVHTRSVRVSSSILYYAAVPYTRHRSTIPRDAAEESPHSDARSWLVHREERPERQEEQDETGRDIPQGHSPSSSLETDQVCFCKDFAVRKKQKNNQPNQPQTTIRPTYY